MLQIVENSGSLTSLIQKQKEAEITLGEIMPLRFKFRLQALIKSLPTITFDSVGQH